MIRLGAVRRWSIIGLFVVISGCSSGQYQQTSSAEPTTATGVPAAASAPVAAATTAPIAPATPDASAPPETTTTRATAATPATSTSASAVSATSASATSTVAPPPTAVDDPPPGQAGPFAIATTNAMFVDPSRPTMETAETPARPDRTIVTTIVFPQAPGPFPLIVLSHGLTGTPDGLSELAQVWATAGYVVALPTFPLTNGAVPNAVSHVGDLVNQPGDVSFVIDELLADTDDPASPLFRRIAGDRIGVAGHSLGGATTYGVAFNACCRDDRIDAVIIMAGLVLVEPDRNDFAVPLPVLILHGDADEVLNIALDVGVYEQLAGPKWFITLFGGTHSPPFGNEPSPADSVVEQTTTDFWDGYLVGDPSALDRLRVDAVVEGVSGLETGEPVAVAG